MNRNKLLGLWCVAAIAAASLMAETKLTNGTCDPEVTKVVRYNIGANGTGSFVSVPRDVTPLDDVYLEITNANPLLYVPVIKAWTADTASQDLLNVSGTSPAKIDPWAASATNSAANAAQQTNSAKPSALAQQSSAAASPQRMVLMNAEVANHQADNHVPEMDRSLQQADADLTSFNTLFEDFAADHKATDSAAAFGLAVRAAKDGLVAAQQTSLPADTSGLKALGDPLESKAADARMTIQNQIGRIAQLKAAANYLTVHHKAVLVAYGDRGSKEQQGLKTLLVSQIDSAAAIASGLDSNQSSLQTARDNVDSAMESLTKALGVAVRAMAEKVFCRLIPRVAGGTDLIVQITVNTISDFSFTTAPQPKAAAAAAGKAGAGADKPADTSGLTELSLDKQRYSVLSPTHVTVTVGAAVSSLANPTIDFRVTPSDKTQIVVYRKSDAHIQVRPVAFLGLYFRPRYQFADAGASYRDSKTGCLKRDWTPYPTIGFSLTDSTSNYFTGAGWDIYRGISVNAGLHIGHVKRLVSGYAEDAPFVKPDNFKVDDILETRWRTGWYASISVDAKTISKALSGLGGSGK